MITKDNIRSPIEALIYIASCSAATCEELAGRKSTSHSSFTRHVAITNIAIEQAERFDQQVQFVENSILAHIPNSNMSGLRRESAHYDEIELVKTRLKDSERDYYRLFPKRNKLYIVTPDNIPTPVMEVLLKQGNQEK
jgi:hypothetical protein